MTEFVTFGETALRLSPPGSERVEMADSLRLYADGTESNAAVAATDFGTDALWVSKVPDDAVGRNVVRQIASAGVETAVTWAPAGERQPLAFRESAATPRASRTWHDRDDSALAGAEPGEFPMETIRDASVVYTGLSTAVVSERAANTVEAVLRASGGGGAVTAVELDYDPGIAPANAYRRAFEGLSEEVDVLFLPKRAARNVLEEGGSPREVVNTLSALYDLQIVVITQPDGSAAALHDTPGTNVIHERSSVETETVDASGEAGVFAGAFLHELVGGSDTARALSFAVASAAFARTIPGPFISTEDDELEALVEQVLENS